jgi:hypothetical protein
VGDVIRPVKFVQGLSWNRWLKLKSVGQVTMEMDALGVVTSKPRKTDQIEVCYTNSAQLLSEWQRTPETPKEGQT